MAVGAGLALNKLDEPPNSELVPPPKLEAPMPAGATPLAAASETSC